MKNKFIIAIMILSILIMTACGNKTSDKIDIETPTEKVEETIEEKVEETTEIKEENVKTEETETETEIETVEKDIDYFNNIKDSIVAKTDHVQYSTYNNDLVLDYYLIDENNLYFDMDICEGYSIEILVTEDSEESYIALNSPDNTETFKVVKANDENNIIEQMIPVVELFKINEIKDVSMQDDAYIIECTLTISDIEFEGYVYCQQDTDEVIAFVYVDNDKYINTAIYECINLPRSSEDFSEAKEVPASEISGIISEFILGALDSVDNTLESDNKTE